MYHNNGKKEEGIWKNDRIEKNVLFIFSISKS